MVLALAVASDPPPCHSSFADDRVLAEAAMSFMQPSTLQSAVSGKSESAASAAKPARGWSCAHLNSSRCWAEQMDR